jgi:hypothetical protein
VLPHAEAASRHSALTLIAAVSPKLGLLHYETETGNVDAARFLMFLDNMTCIYCIACAKRVVEGQPRLLVWDNVAYHHTPAINDWLSKAKTIWTKHALPPCSPFLNPIEEVFAYWKYQYSQMDHWRGTPDASIAVDSLIVETSRFITPLLVSQYYEHTKRFWAQCIERKPVLSREILDKQHDGDEVRVSSADVQAVVERYLPAAGLLPPDILDQLGRSRHTGTHVVDLETVIAAEAAAREETEAQAEGRTTNSTTTTSQGGVTEHEEGQQARPRDGTGG